MITLFFNDDSIEHEFHIVPDDFNIQTDGIIGKDFLNKYNCNISYSNMTLTVNADGHANVIRISNGPDKFSVVIPPRCEVIREFEIDSQEECIVDNCEIVPGVFLARTVVNPKSAFIRVLNTTDDSHKINKKITSARAIDQLQLFHS